MSEKKQSRTADEIMDEMTSIMILYHQVKSLIIRRNPHAAVLIEAEADNGSLLFDRWLLIAETYLRINAYKGNNKTVETILKVDEDLAETITCDWKEMARIKRKIKFRNKPKYADRSSKGINKKSCSKYSESDIQYRAELEANEDLEIEMAYNDADTDAGNDSSDDEEQILTRNFTVSDWIIRGD